MSSVRGPQRPPRHPTQDAWHDGKDVDSLVDWARVRDVLAEEQLAALSERGFVVVDGFWGREWSAAFRAEMDHLVRTDSMRPNKTAFTDAQVRSSALRSTLLARPRSTFSPHGTARVRPTARACTHRAAPF